MRLLVPAAAIPGYSLPNLDFLRMRCMYSHMYVCMGVCVQKHVNTSPCMRECKLADWSGAIDVFVCETSRYLKLDKIKLTQQL